MQKRPGHRHEFKMSGVHHYISAADQTAQKAYMYACEHCDEEWLIRRVDLIGD